MRALWAYNVFHHHHLMHAAASTGLGGQALLPWAPGRWTSRVAGAPGMRATPLGRLAKRSVLQFPPGVRGNDLGLAEFIGPLLSTVGREPSHRLQDQVLQRQGRRIRAHARGAELVHTCEGLALEYLTADHGGHSVVERRALHQRVLAAPVEVVGSFPGRPAQPGGLLVDRSDAEMRLADTVVVYSATAKQSFVDNGVAPDKVHVVPLGTTEQAPTLDEMVDVDPFELLYIGRGSTVKGLDLAVAVVEALGAPFRLTTAGYMPDQVAAWLRVHPAVTNEGQVSRYRLRELARRSALLLAPSTESFGLSALDAAANGCHVLALPTTGLTEWLAPTAITTVPGRAVEPWADAVTTALGQGLGERDRRSITARAAAELTWDAAGRHLATLYVDRCLPGRPAVPAGIPE